LLFLNPDVTLTSSHAIDDMFIFAKANPNIGITSCRTLDPNGKREREIAFLNPWLTIGWLRAMYKLALSHKIAINFKENNEIWYPEWVAGSVILIQKDFFKKIGKWSENNFWMYSEDSDICLKSKNCGKKIALLRNVELSHSHGGSSRRNPKTTAITKSEVVTSSHVFIHLYTKGINRLALHLVIMIYTLASWLLRTIITLPFFWKGFFRANLFTLVVIIKYYLSVLIRWTWKSKRLKSNGS
jgi:GT2 family glycosyltransferase